MKLFLKIIAGFFLAVVLLILTVYQGWIPLLPSESKILKLYQEGSENISQKIDQSQQKRLEELESYFVKHSKVTEPQKVKYRIAVKDFYQRIKQRTLALGDEFVSEMLNIRRDQKLLQGQKFIKVAELMKRYEKIVEQEKQDGMIQLKKDIAALSLAK